jgi:hypothetical protein
MNKYTSAELVNRLVTLQELCPEMRFGQMLATLNLLAEDMTERDFWEIGDDEFVEVIERFRRDLESRKVGVNHP